MEKYIIAVFVTVFVASAQATICKNNTVCAAGECCYIQPEFMVVSRRSDLRPITLPLQPISNKHDTGVCEKYRVLHEHCGPLEQMNGHCGCGTGMTCQFVADPTVALPVAVQIQQVSRRKARKIYVPGPGSFQCELKP